MNNNNNNNNIRLLALAIKLLKDEFGYVCFWYTTENDYIVQTPYCNINFDTIEQVEIFVLDKYEMLSNDNK